MHPGRRPMEKQNSWFHLVMAGKHPTPSDLTGDLSDLTSLYVSSSHGTGANHRDLWGAHLAFLTFAVTIV